jgi:carboxyl-terminal processing protease
MTRTVFILLVCIMASVALWARPGLAAPAFDAAMAASVWSAALTYIAPRSLTPLTIPQMTIWGLNGLTALDPDLNAALQGNQLRLYGPDRMLIALPAPPSADAAAWGQAASRIAGAAYDASPALQQAGTSGVIESFFDELFNHFDPYSRYEPPVQAARDQLMITGIAGTGILLGRDGNNVVISDVAPDSPGAEAGISPGAQVLSINGKPAFAGQLALLNANLAGIPGSTVMLRLRDPEAAGQPNDVMLTRALVPQQTVTQETNVPPGILALKIGSFNTGTSDQFSAALVAGLGATPPPEALLIDLRGNRGGVLRQAVLVADSLLPAGKIVEAAGRDPDADQSFSAEGSDLTGGLPIAVLVDGQTASAAEILAAALADNRRAVVIGSATLGKGLVQTLTALPDGGELFVTWSRVLAPRGWPLQTLGVMPEICTSLGAPGLTAQLRALSTGRNLLAPALAAARAARAPVPVSAILNIRNQCPADIGGDLDMTAATRILASQALYRAALMPVGAER